jgi:hypothetical protein
VQRRGGVAFAAGVLSVRRGLINNPRHAVGGPALPNAWRRLVVGERTYAIRGVTFVTLRKVQANS